MATATFGTPIKKVYGETVSLTTTAAHLLFRPKYHEIMMYCATDWRMGFGPRLAKVLYYDASTYTDYTTYAADRNDATHVPLDGMLANHILYLGVTEPTRGFYFNIDDSHLNDEAATLDFEYCSAISSSGVATFTDVANDSDGTNSVADTLKVDGLYAFTLPAVVRGVVPSLSPGPLYWYRFKPSATLSAEIDLIDIIPASDTVSYGYMEGGLSYQFTVDTVRNGAFEFDHASTDTLYITWVEH